jgi:hypothetical protein
MLAAIALLLLATLGYIGLCSAQPFGPCRRCKGFGCIVRQTRTGRLRRGKDCRRCRATGLRLRTGRRIYNAWMRAKADNAR